MNLDYPISNFFAAITTDFMTWLAEDGGVAFTFVMVFVEEIVMPIYTTIGLVEEVNILYEFDNNPSFLEEKGLTSTAKVLDTFDEGEDENEDDNKDGQNDGSDSHDNSEG